MRLKLFSILILGYGFAFEIAKSDNKDGLPYFKFDYTMDKYNDYFFRLRLFYIYRFIFRIHLNR